MSSIAATSGAVIPAIIVITILVMLAANLVARRLTKNILRPLDWIDLECDVENAAVYEELIPYVKKIDQQKRQIASQMAALKNRADTIEVITGNMKEGLILIDNAGSVLHANNSAAVIFRNSDMASRNILHIYRDLEFQNGVKNCLSGVNTELTIRFGGRLYDVFFSPVRDGREITGGVILFLDSTERHEAERQRREFSANVSHELKTPLTTVSGLAELIWNGMAKQEDIKGFAEKITTQTKRVVSIIEDIIRLSEFDEGTVSREYSEIDLRELADSVVEALQEKAEEKHVAISVSGENIHLSANKRMIDELLYNLIDNAIKYNKENGSVTVSLSMEDRLCKIAVADTGIGIPEEHHNRVFERFYRVDKSRYKKTGGTGLGLSIVKHIAEHHYGCVELSSTEGIGTTVVCWIAAEER